MLKTVLAFGEALWDVLPAGPQLGGAPLNFACRVRALGNRSMLVSRVGRDDYGRLALARIAELGLDLSHIQVDEQHPTGTVNVSVDAQGNPAFHIVAGVAYDFIEARSDLMELARGADLIYFGTLIQRSAGSRAALLQMLDQTRDKTAFLDLNLRPDCYSPETVVDSLRRADILKLNEQEVECLAELFPLPPHSVPEFCAAALERWSLACCLVTLGERGAFAASAEGDLIYTPGYAVDVVDTCGSGDAFSAGFVHAWLDGAPLSDCCRLGCALGAMVAAQRGATTPISIKEIRAFTRLKHRLVPEPALQAFAPG